MVTSSNQEVASKLAPDNEQLRFGYFDRSVTICSMNITLELRVDSIFQQPTTIQSHVILRQPVSLKKKKKKKKEHYDPKTSEVACSLEGTLHRRGVAARTACVQGNKQVSSGGLSQNPGSVYKMFGDALTSFLPSHTTQG